MAVTMEFVARVLRPFDDCDVHPELFWRVDDDNRVQFFAMCNDAFWWGTADAEEITPENVWVLEESSRDLRALGEVLAPIRLAELFAARVRGMRLQRPAYKKLSPAVAALFDACGPERDRKDEG